VSEHLTHHIISDRLRVFDKNGRRWRRHESYQDNAPFEPGWMAMVSEDGKVMPHATIVGMYGFDGPEGKYLGVEEGTYP